MESFPGGRVVEAGTGFAGTGFSRMVTATSVTGGVTMWYLRLQTFIMSLLEDESGANAVEYALIMALVAVFIIAATHFEMR